MNRLLLTSLAIFCLIYGCDKKDKGGQGEAAESGSKSATAKAPEKSAPAEVLEVTVSEAKRLPEVTGGGTTIKALPGSELVCVRYRVKSSSEITMDPPKVAVASGKSYYYNQHATKAFADDAWPKHGLMEPLKANVEQPYSLCFELNTKEAGEELSLQAKPSKGEPKSVAFKAGA